MPTKCIVCKLKYPCFNYEGQKKATHCGGCKLENMIDITHPKCITCKIKRPTFNLPNEKTATYCADCKLENMINITDNKCTVCKIKISTFNYEGKKKPTHCSGCKLEGMIDIRHRKCILCKIKIPTFNLPNEKTPTHCSKCKLEGMIDIKSPKCIVCNKTIPIFNLPDKKTATHCGSCKLKGMIDVKNSKCIVCNEQRAYFNLPDKKTATHCSGCKLENMRDIYHPKCKSDWCDIIISNKKYKGYCLHCFINLFPNEKVSRNYKTKEFAVSDYIKTEFPDMDWICDKQINNGCSKKRPDLLLDLGYQVLIIEIDENQHRDYDSSCESFRLVQISQDLNHRPIIFIRFNPDDYLNNNKKITSCWGVNGNGICCVKKSKKKEWKERLNILKDTVNYWINEEHKTDKTIEVIQLFYDR